MFLACDTLPKSQPIVTRLPLELLNWLDEKVEKRDFASRSHGVVWCISKMMEREQEEEQEK